MRECFLAPAEDRSKAGRIIERLVLCFFGLMDLIIIYQALTNSFDEWPPFKYERAAIYVLAAVLCCLLIMRLKAFPGYVLWAVMLLSLAVRLFLALTVPTEPASDFLALYTAAGSSAAGDFSWSHSQEINDYFRTWGYQIPFVLYEALILRLFHSILALKLLNVLFMVGSNYLVYRIGKLFLSGTAALCVALLYAVFPDLLYYTTVLTNQHIALFFLLLGVLLLLRAGRRWEFALAGLALAVSDLMRPEAVTVLAACLCCAALRCIQSPKLMTLKHFALSLAPVLVCYWLTKRLTEGLLVWTDIAPYGIQNRAPEWKFILGLGNVEGFGAYSLEHGDILSMDSAARRAATTQLIADLFRRPAEEVLDFFVGKLRVFWAGEGSLYWAFYELDRNLLILPKAGLPLSSLLNLEWCGLGMQLLAYLLALPVPVLLWKDGKKRGGECLFCVAVVCVIICVFLLIETQTRYRLFADPFWLLIDGVTIERLTQCKKREL